MKLAAVGLVAFLVGLAGSTGLVVWRGRATSAVTGPGEAPLAERSAPSAPDSSRTEPDPAPRSGRDRDSAAGPQQRAAPADTAPTPPGGTTAPPSPSVPAQPGTAGTAGAGERELAFRQLGKIFSAMRPGDAARVMGYLSDDEVEAILRQVGVRQAASLLSAFPQERAAALSRRLLAPDPAPAGAGVAGGGR